MKGLLNIQFIVENGRVWMLEVNPRASRTVPFLTKVTGVPLVKLAVAIALGSSLAAEGYARADGIWPTGEFVALKAPVFSMAKLLDVDTYLGPEMKSTGEVMGIDRSFAPALWKSLVAAGLAPARSGKILVTVADKDKPEVVEIIEGFHWLGYDLVATSGTAALVRSLGLDVTEIKKLAEGSQEHRKQEAGEGFEQHQAAAPEQVRHRQEDQQHDHPMDEVPQSAGDARSLLAGVRVAQLACAASGLIAAATAVSGLVIGSKKNYG